MHNRSQHVTVIMEACAEVFAEVNIDARCQSGHVFLPHPAQEYSFWTRGTSQLMSVPGVFRTKPLTETVFPLKGILVVPPPQKKNKKKKTSTSTTASVSALVSFISHDSLRARL